MFVSSKLDNKYPHWILKVLGCLFWILLLFEQNLCWHVPITCLEVALPASLTFCLYGGFYLFIPNWYELFLFKLTALLLLPRTCVSKINKITWFVHCSSEQQALQDPAAWGWRTPSWVSWPLGSSKSTRGRDTGSNRVCGTSPASRRSLYIQEEQKYYLDPGINCPCCTSASVAPGGDPDPGCLPRAGCSLLANIICPGSPETVSSALLNLGTWAAWMWEPQRAERVCRDHQEPWETDHIAARVVAERIARGLGMEVYMGYHFSSRLNKLYNSWFSPTWPLPTPTNKSPAAQWLACHQC